jgi:hypothetical protein
MNFIHKTARVPISSDQILTLNSVPVEILAGTPGSIINIYSLYLRLFHGDTPYNPQTDDVFVFYLGNPNNTTLISFGSSPGGARATGFVDQTQDMSCWLMPFMCGDGNSDASADLTVDILGSGLWLTQFTGPTGNFPSGTDWTQGDGTLLALVEYSVIQP